MAFDNFLKSVLDTCLQIVPMIQDTALQILTWFSQPLFQPEIGEFFGFNPSVLQVVLGGALLFILSSAIYIFILNLIRGT